MSRLDWIFMSILGVVLTIGIVGLIIIANLPKPPQSLINATNASKIELGWSYKQCVSLLGDPTQGVIMSNTGMVKLVDGYFWIRVDLDHMLVVGVNYGNG